MRSKLFLRIYLLCYCLGYLTLGVFSEKVGDYLVYIGMHKNGFFEAFENQPLFTLYAETLRAVTSNSELFFVVLPLPFLYYIFISNINKVYASGSFLILFTIALPFAMSPESFYFLFRQNLGLIILQALISYNVIFAFVVASGFHYSFLVIFLSFMLYGRLFEMGFSLLQKIVILLISYFILYYLSSSLFGFFEHFIDIDVAVVTTYYSVYSEYTDEFPGILNLYLYSLGSILIYLLFLDGLNFRLIRLSATLVSSVIAIAIFTNQSDPIEYRYLQATKISATIIYAYFVIFLYKNYFRSSNQNRIPVHNRTM